MDDSLLEIMVQDQVLQTRLRAAMLNQLAIVEKLQQQALFDTPPGHIHTDIRSATDALMNLMEANGEAMVVVDEVEG